MLQDSAVWHQYEFGLAGANFRWSFAGDSLWNNVLYKHIRREDVEVSMYFDSALVREDTSARRVYFTRGTPEYLAYDFSLLPGDTVTVRNGFAPNAPYTMPLDSIGTTPPPGVTCSLTAPRFFYLHTLQQSYPCVWLEGVGGYSGINEPVNSSSTLLCHTDSNGFLDYEYPLLQSPPGSCLGEPFPGTVQELSSGPTLVVSPNPASNTVQVAITLPPGLVVDNDAMLTLVDAQGCKVMEQALPSLSPSGSLTLLLGSFSSGLYFLHITHGKHWQAGVRVMKE